MEFNNNIYTFISLHMTKPLRNITILCILAFAVSNSHAQFSVRSVIASAGETYTTPDVTISFVAGEAVGGLLSNEQVDPHLYLTTGFEQPDVEVSQALANSPRSLAISPNPANGGIVKLGFNHVPDGTYTINVFDASGKILQSQTVNYKAIDYYYFPIDVSHYAGGVYFIQVVNPTLFHGEVKLIKY